MAHHLGTTEDEKNETPAFLGCVNNSQHCWRIVACVLAVVCKRMQQLPTMLGPVEHRGKDTTHKSL